jgi:hypothetical protein
VYNWWRPIQPEDSKIVREYPPQAWIWTSRNGLRAMRLVAQRLCW